MYDSRFLAAVLLSCALIPPTTASAEFNGSQLICTFCEQIVEIEAMDPEPSPLQQLGWSGDYSLGDLEEEFTCPDQVYEFGRMAASRYEVSNLAICDIAPDGTEEALGLMAYYGLCGGIDEGQLRLLLGLGWSESNVVLFNDLSISIPVDYQLMSRIFLGAADLTKWEFSCSPWFNSGIRYTVASGSLEGAEGNTMGSGLSVPRFPERCHDRRFTVRASEGEVARIYSLRANRRVCEPSAEYPVPYDL